MWLPQSNTSPYNEQMPGSPCPVYMEADSVLNCLLSGVRNELPTSAPPLSWYHHIWESDSPPATIPTNISTSLARPNTVRVEDMSVNILELNVLPTNTRKALQAAGRKKSKIHSTSNWSVTWRTEASQFLWRVLSVCWNNLTKSILFNKPFHRLQPVLSSCRCTACFLLLPSTLCPGLSQPSVYSCHCTYLNTWWYFSPLWDTKVPLMYKAHTHKYGPAHVHRYMHTMWAYHVIIWNSYQVFQGLKWNPVKEYRKCNVIQRRPIINL